MGLRTDRASTTLRLAAAEEQEGATEAPATDDERALALCVMLEISETESHNSMSSLTSRIVSSGNLGRSLADLFILQPLQIVVRL